jgi:hypothetical protein
MYLVIYKFITVATNVVFFYDLITLQRSVENEIADAKLLSPEVQDGGGGQNQEPGSCGWRCAGLSPQVSVIREMEIYNLVVWSSVPSAVLWIPIVFLLVT